MKDRRGSLLLAVILLLTCSLFLIDLLTPPRIAVWVPYVTVILLSLWLPHRIYTHLIAALCTLLALLGLLLSPPGDILWIAVTNRVLAVAAFWLAAFVGLAARRVAELEKANAALQKEIVRREEVEAQLLRTQRLESIGVLAGGLAHDFNNLLTPILMAAKLLREDRPEDERQHLLGTLQTSAERGAEVVRQLLSFAGGVGGRRVPVQFCDIVKEVKAIVDHTFPKTIQVHTHLDNNLRQVLAEPTQLAQVLLNLCVNARDAMPAGGTLAIAARNVHLSEKEASDNTGARAGPHLLVTVSDTGTGIAPEVLDRVFDPFFTTKEHGKGTGLGLSTALGIVKSHEGFIRIQSEAGRGTQFAVYLPLHTDAEGRDIPAGQEVPEGKGEGVLIVDDERLILEMAGKTLQEHGYRVLTAADGESALELLDAHPGNIQVALLDMMMPGMDGPALMAEVRRRAPDVRILASSGLQAGGLAADKIAASGSAFLQKPYREDQLLAAVANVLHGN